MKRNENATCENCPCWLHHRDGRGDCRFAEPSFSNGEGVSLWPITYAHSWCRQHPDFNAEAEMWPKFFHRAT